jgi:MFS family permease
MVRNMPSYRALARQHDFTALWIGQTVSEIGTRMTLFVFPLLTFALTGSALAAAAAEALHLLGLAGTLLPAGVLADRVDRRRIMRTASAVGVLGYGSLVAAALAGALTVPHLLAVALLTGIGAGLFAPAEMAAVRAIVPAEDLPTALSQNQARLHVAGLLSAPLGGALYAAARWAPFAADAVSFAVSWLLLGRLRTDLRPAPHEGPRRHPGRELAAGLRFVTTQPFFRVLLVWGALTNLAVNALFFVAVLRLIQGGFDAVHIGLVESVAGAAGILGAVLAPWLIERVPTGRLTVGIAWSFLPLVVPMALWNHPAVVAAALGLGMLVNPAGNAGIASYRLAVTPPELIGRVQSTTQFVSMSALPLAPVLAGGMLAWLGGPLAIGVLGVLGGCVALIPTLSASVRSVPRPADWDRHARQPGGPDAGGVSPRGMAA